MIALVFPGQGSQYVGMGKDLYDNFSCAKEVFQEIDESLNFKLSEIIFHGSTEQLNTTYNTQPAIMGISIAISRVLQKEFKIKLSSKISYCAGHSLGEYSALCASEAISLADTARILYTRGQEMQKAVPVGKGAMVALIGTNINTVTEIIKNSSSKENFCEISNDNSKDQIVISGHIESVKKAILISKDYNVKRAVLLPVSAPFHSILMKSAAIKMHQYLCNIKDINTPNIPVICNTSATPIIKKSEIIPNLVKQITSRVRWVESVNYMISKNCNTFIELGPKKTLSGLIKNINKNVTTYSIEKLDDLDILGKLNF